MAVTEADLVRAIEALRTEGYEPDTERVFAQLERDDAIAQRGAE
jgi:hypothetical protein